MKPIKLAIIGCGRVSTHHANMMRELDNIKLVCVADLKEDRAKAFSAEYGVPYYLSYHDMLKKEDIDVVSIVTPSGMHTRHALDVINNYKKHVVIEKPLVLNLDDAKVLEEAAKKQGVKIYPIYQNRFNRAVQRVRTAIDSGELGKIVMGSVRVHWCRPQAYYDRDAWRGTWAMDGGALTNQGVHYIDLLQWLVGEPETVHTQKATQLVDVEVEDTMTGLLKFKSGAVGTIEITTAARPRDFEASIIIMGEKGTAILSGIATNELKEFTLKPEECEAHSEVFPTVYGHGHKLLLKSVADDLMGQGEYPISMADSLSAIRLLNACYASAETGKTVNYDEWPKSSLLGRHDQKLVDLYTTK